MSEVEAEHQRVVLEDISSLAWEHPADAAALNSLRQMPGFDIAVRKVFGLIAERTLRMMALGSSVEVSTAQYPDINEIYEDVLRTLDAPERYPLFLTQSPVVNAGAVGMEQPFILLNSGTVRLMSEAQLRYVLGHEVGHILSEHVLYKTMLQLMVRLSRVAFTNVVSGMAYTAIMAALMEWDRKSELSSDRAGLLAVQDPDTVRAALLRSAGGVGEGASIEAFQEQARRYEEDQSSFDSIARALALMNQHHPFPVQRLKEIDAWVDSGDYEKILAGDYHRRSDEPHTNKQKPWDVWRESASVYAESIKNTSVRGWFRGLRSRMGGEEE
ncbi:MAG: Zn-dependent protease with chaperone function [Myxococcota bacterium]|jgi:Zn-dependent protease with chaperone function